MPEIHHTLFRIDTLEFVDAVNERDRVLPSGWSHRVWLDPAQLKRVSLEELDAIIDSMNRSIGDIAFERSERLRMDLEERYGLE
jgi:hypothetical protein